MWQRTIIQLLVKHPPKFQGLHKTWHHLHKPIDLHMNDLVRRRISCQTKLELDVIRFHGGKGENVHHIYCLEVRCRGEVCGQGSQYVGGEENIRTLKEGVSFMVWKVVLGSIA